MKKSQNKNFSKNKNKIRFRHSIFIGNFKELINGQLVYKRMRKNTKTNSLKQ